MITKVFDVLFAKFLNKVLWWALFYQTESEVWTGFGHLGSLEFINFLYVLGILTSIQIKQGGE